MINPLKSLGRMSFEELHPAGPLRGRGRRTQVGDQDTLSRATSLLSLAFVTRSARISSYSSYRWETGAIGALSQAAGALNGGDLKIPNTEFTLWLVPQEPLQSKLREIIRRLSDEFDAVEFEPHVTLFSAPSNDAEARAIVSRISRQFPPVHLILNGLEHTEVYTKTLFIQFDESVVARQMSEIAGNGFSKPSKYQLNPHLSLLYKKLPQAKQKELCRTLNVPQGVYLFDRIRILKTEVPIEDAGPIRGWRTVCDAALYGR
jgi:Cyclic phosphodiesterase-like protein